MFNTYPKSKKTYPKLSKGKGDKIEELSSMNSTKNTITDSEEKRIEQVYGNFYGKKSPQMRKEPNGIMVSPRKYIIGI